MPSFWNILEVSDLPIPIEPVRPICSGRLAGTQGLLQMGAQCRCHDGPDTEERFEGRYALVHQHAETVHRPPARGARFFVFWCFVWVVDVVVFCCVFFL